MSALDSGFSFILYFISAVIYQTGPSEYSDPENPAKSAVWLQSGGQRNLVDNVE